MALSAGTRLGPYEILTSIGAGGMGEVYRARDTRLDRTVALKILPSELASDPERRQRFDLEARATANLSHPHVCPLYDVGESEGVAFLVMEYLEGQTLAERLRKGPLPLSQSLRTAIEIAEALDAAHKVGVVHRDLKPANVMLTKGGAKLLDFGLARLKGHGERPALAGDLSLPTQPNPLTARGTVVGTLQYMAPEQLEGRPADARTDLWALGAIVYEMVTGRRPFAATSAVSLMGAILERDPEPVGKVQPLTPPALEWTIRRCLAKSPEDRWDSAHDVAEELRWIAQDSSAAIAPAPWLRAARRAPWWAGVSLVLGGLIGVVGSWAYLSSRPRPGNAPVHSLLDVTPAEQLDSGGFMMGWETLTRGGSRTALDLSSDGRRLVFVGRTGDTSKLYVRRLDEDVARELPGTEFPHNPVFSPDGRWVAFWAVRAGRLRKVPVDGGPAADVCELKTPPQGLTWLGGDTLVLGSYVGGGLQQVPSAGGTPAPFTQLAKGEISHSLPHALPEGRGLLYTARSSDVRWGTETTVVEAPGSGQHRVLFPDGADARYVPSGHLVFVRLSTLMAVPFDLRSLETRGAPFPVIEGVAQAANEVNSGDATGAGQFAVSPAGSLAYVTGAVVPPFLCDLVWLDRRGRVQPLSARQLPYNYYPRLSPDGGRVAVTTLDYREGGLWVHDVGRATTMRLAAEAESWSAVWSHDGHDLFLDGTLRGESFLIRRPADGTGTEKRWPWKGPPSFNVGSLSPDDHELAVVTLSERGDTDIWMVSVSEEPPTPRPWLSTPAYEQDPEFSPDGRWILYSSSASGRREVYAQPHGREGAAIQVSAEGGFSPAWNPDGRELFYVSRRGTETVLMAVEVTLGPTPRFGPARPLFPMAANTRTRRYDVAPDGQRFLDLRDAPREEPPSPVTHVRLVEHWLEELKARAAATRAR